MTDLITADNFYVVAIALLLPLTASMLVVQVNPYHALVIRGILGAVAALVYALFGAADVALTEALVGTMLSITLYAVAVRSSMSMRVGVLETDASDITAAETAQPLRAALHQPLSRHHLRLEWVPYPDLDALKTALATKEIHTTCILAEANGTHTAPRYYLQTRLQRLYDLIAAELPSDLASLGYVPSEEPSEQMVKT
jgi:putative multicomponent Na+:H+ antiporter subunit B